MLRIGKMRDGSKLGVFFYCQEHGNEIATSGVCLETAERLVRNYGTDARTTALVDNLDIFIIPQINGDGATHSLYDSNRRKNLSNHCEDTVKFPQKKTDPAARNSWGVDMNRNFRRLGLRRLSRARRRTDCTSGNFAGPNESLRARGPQRDLGADDVPQHQVRQQHPLVRRLVHVASRRLHAPARAAALPAVRHAELLRPDGKQVLDGIKSHRGLTIVPSRTGPVIDVLYSAAGNSADEAYYANGIIGYDFEIGTTYYYKTRRPASSPPAAPASSRSSAPTTNAVHADEGFHEAMEYASGNYGMLDAAMAYSADMTAPVVTATGDSVSNTTQNVRFVSNEAASIYYTTDGSTPTRVPGVEAAARPGAPAPGRDQR